MPSYICKFQDGDTDYYLEWSTIVDAPVTYGMKLEDFKEYYRDEYGSNGIKGLSERMERVEEKGTSGRNYDSLDDLINGNHAGKDGTCFSKEQIIEWYCRRPNDEMPYGKRYNPEKDIYEEVKE